MRVDEFLDVVSIFEHMWHKRWHVFGYVSADIHGYINVKGTTSLNELISKGGES